jgi:hypothetical protein
MNFIEKRKMERFDLKFSALLSMMDESRNQRAFEVMIGDICSGGAFFKISAPLPVGTRVKMNLILSQDKFNIGKRIETHIDVSGSVIRTERQGIAVCFDKKYSITPLNR